MTSHSRSEQSKCRLCQKETNLFYQAEKPFKADYYHCSNCDLVQMDESSLLEEQAEKSHYKMHENDKREPGYLEFLGRCLEPTIPYLVPGMSGLDFGCGPYPMLAEIMGERGYPMDHWDPYFYPDKSKLQEHYDFVTATEVVEHFNNPISSWRELVGRVRHGGILSIMTSLRYSHVDFDGWHYRRDATHVCFYSEKTMDFIAKEYGLEILENPKNVIVYKKL